MEQANFDIGIIGSGPAGLAAAFEAQQLGQKVVIIEEYMWGGTCPNYGCDPKKILLSAVEILHREQALQNKGLVGSSRINWPELMAIKQEYVDAVKPRKIKGLEQATIEHIYGHAQFINRNTITTENQKIQATNWIIATGQRPRQLDFPGADLMLDSEDFLNLAEMPQDITFLGGGYIGVEFANISHFADANVHLITQGNHLLSDFDQLLVGKFEQEMIHNGVDITFNATIVEIKKYEGQYLIRLSNGTTYLTDLVISAVGRVGNADKIHAENAGIEIRDGHILVDQYLRSTNPDIYAIGDVADNDVPKLVPVGNYEGRYVARRLSDQTSEALQYPTMPQVVFGTPRIAQTGLSMKDAQKQGFVVKDLELGKVITFFRYHDDAHIRVALNQTGQIVGASILAFEAEELINYFVTAINTKRTFEETQANLYAYPSLGSEFAEFY
ncbi:NAD(P)/FAD-dependent oxidoreductase [Weissella coleopterorum]|uniref:NAD(P)/FAD-dependent oxidoreductase n=1 Tax=Weissella coleopterorum TaxID=2714949 RepID=A0A6G8B0F4_9LACO|nr:NAD(P)/FAD-dependent oxidoreductase [Weissella coleopterorum]QIL50695.1 NAD(P)/FAD-dependent oxidoreductase [Weissella coleopterorum]